VIVGLFLQQIIALFVLKTKAGFDIFSWIAWLAADFLGQSHAGAVFFFEESVTHWFFIGVVSSRVTSSGAYLFTSDIPSLPRSSFSLHSFR
jgi:nucleoside permease NupC